MLPVRDKLISLSKFIANNGDKISGQTCNKQDLFTDWRAYGEEFVTLANLNQVVYEYVQVAERRSLSELKAFLRRCLDVIDFLCYIEDEVEKTHGRRFEDLMRELGPRL